MLDSNNFNVRIFKAVNRHEYFVTLTLTEEELIKEAVMSCYQVKVQNFSLKVPFSEKLKKDLVPFISQDVQILTKKKLERVFNLEDLKK